MRNFLLRTSARCWILEVHSVPGRTVWSSCLPIKVSFFAWQVHGRKLMDLGQFKKKGKSLANKCFLCCVKEEFVDHILI